MFSLRDRKSPRDETAKLTATYVNGVAVGIAVLGGIAPYINLALGGGARSGGVGVLLGLSSICIGSATAVHLGARWYLRRELTR